MKRAASNGTPVFAWAHSPNGMMLFTENPDTAASYEAQAGVETIPLIRLSDYEAALSAPSSEGGEKPVGDDEETYQLGVRDGYEKAVQEIDEQTGGDGEYRYVMGGDPDRHTPDAPSMIRRIVERFAALSQPEQQGGGAVAFAHHWEDASGHDRFSRHVPTITGNSVVTALYAHPPLTPIPDPKDLETELREAREEIERCHKRLEIDHHFVMGSDVDDLTRVEVPFAERKAQIDGIECRNATIAALEEDISRLRALIARVDETGDEE